MVNQDNLVLKVQRENLERFVVFREFLVKKVIEDIQEQKEMSDVRVKRANRVSKEILVYLDIMEQKYVTY